MHRREFLTRLTANMAMALIVVASGSRRAVAQGLRPARRARPLVAIVADNAGTETTDLMIPHAVLSRCGAVDVVVVAPEPGRITLMPALAISAQLALAEFDARYPEGADCVVVPALHHADNERILAWLARQFARRANIAGICEGARVLGKAGLLDGRAATTHWYAAQELRKAYPTMRWVSNRRYVVDDGIMTTTGVSASLPAALVLVEAIAGRQRAQELAAQLGIRDLGDGHDSGRFHLGAAHVWRVIANTALLWRHETVEIAAQAGLDGIALALTADAWSRTYRSQAVLTAPAGWSGPLPSQDGLLLHTQPAQAGTLPLSLQGDLPAAAHLERALAAISARYGSSTAALVALQLEYAWPQ